MKRPKPARRLDLDPRHWMPLVEAFQRARTALGSIALAEQDLRNRLLSMNPAQRLQAAYRALALSAEHPHGREMISGLIKRAQWQNYRLWGSSDGTVRLRRIIREADAENLNLAGGGVYIFIRRAEFDRHYPPPAPVSEPRADGEPQRRKRGPKIKQDWRLFASHAAYEFKEKHGRVPSGSELAQICQDKIDYQPELSEISRLFRFLLGD
jgi:hypothetical protein